MGVLTARDQISNVAKAHAGCSARQNVRTYIDAVVRPADMNPRGLTYFLGHGGNPPSTCALFALGVYRLVGMTDPELVLPYVPGQATIDLRKVSDRHRASSLPGDASTFLAGDVWMIADARGMDAHVGVCVRDAEPQPDGSIQVDTVEGGQGPDSSGIQAFTRSWKKIAGCWMNGSRFLILQVKADRLGIPDGSDGTTSGSDMSGDVPGGASPVAS